MTKTKSKSKKQEWEVLSPDGFSIQRGIRYGSESEAITALTKWIERYAHQGYYSFCGERIPLDELPTECSITQIK